MQHRQIIHFRCKITLLSGFDKKVRGLVYLPLSIQLSLLSGNVGDPELHSLGAAAGHRDDLVLLVASNGEVQMPGTIFY